MNAFIGWVTFACFAVAATITSRAHAAENIIVKILPSIAIESGAPLPITITVGTAAASGVKVGYVGLIEKQYKRLIAPEGLRLCKSASQPCNDTSLALEANQSHNLWLWGVSGEGVYEGALTISSVEKPAGDSSTTMTIYVSSARAKLFGVLLIAFSVGAAFLFSVIFRSLLNRKQLLLPVASMLETLHLLKTRTSQLSQKLLSLCSETIKQIKSIQDALDIQSLEVVGLPPALPRFTSGPTVDNYRVYVATKSQHTQVLNIVVSEGLAAVDEYLSASSASPIPDPVIKTAVDTIEAAARYKSASPPSEDSIRQAIAAALQSLRAASVTKTLDARKKYVERQEQLRLEITAINLASWVFVLVLTTVAGALALVLTGESALGFGTLSDYVKCIFWGLGLPASSQLASATMSTVTTTFGIPKVAQS